MLAAINAARPRAILTLTRSRSEQEPLFVEFDKATVITLTSPTALDRQAFERSLSEALSERLMVHGQKLDGGWVTRSDNGLTWRQLDAPSLGWGVQYAIQGNQLVIANEPAFFTALLSTRTQSSTTSPSSFSEVTVVRPGVIRSDFESTFKKLSAVKNDFFVGNILSLVDSAPEIETIKRDRSYQGNLMREQLKMTFRQQAPNNEKATPEISTPKWLYFMGWSREDGILTSR